MNREEYIAAMQGTISRPIPLNVKHWGDIHVRPRSLEEVDEDAEDEAKAQESDKTSGKKRRLARAVMKVLCDENGKRVFTEADLDFLANQSYYALRKVLAAAGGEDDEDAGKSEGATS